MIDCFYSSRCYLFFCSFFLSFWTVSLQFICDNQKDNPVYEVKSTLKSSLLMANAKWRGLTLKVKNLLFSFFVILVRKKVKGDSVVFFCNRQRITSANWSFAVKIEALQWKYSKLEKMEGEALSWFSWRLCKKRTCYYNFELDQRLMKIDYLKQENGPIIKESVRFVYIFVEKS